MEQKRWMFLGGVTASVVLAGALTCGGARAAQQGPDQDCSEVAQDQLLGCDNSALETYWLAVARCDNAAEDDPAGACPAAAQQDLKTGRADCADQLDARRKICIDLGGGKYNPAINPANFSTNITNPLFPLIPGTTFIYEGDTAAGREHDEFQVTRKTHTFLGVKCVAVHDAVSVDGVLTEDTLDWFAQDKFGNVWYFGEESKQYEDGVLVGIDGSWQAGVDDAKPGIVMKAKPKAGDVYRQEYAISEAEDMADVVGLGRRVSVPFVSSNNALQTHEFSGLEPTASEQKFYVPNVGFVLSVDDETGERLELINIVKK